MHVTQDMLVRGRLKWRSGILYVFPSLQFRGSTYMWSSLYVEIYGICMLTITTLCLAQLYDYNCSSSIDGFNINWKLCDWLEFEAEMVKLCCSETHTDTDTDPFIITVRTNFIHLTFTFLFLLLTFIQLFQLFNWVLSSINKWIWMNERMNAMTKKAICSVETHISSRRWTKDPASSCHVGRGHWGLSTPECRGQTGSQAMPVPSSPVFDSWTRCATDHYKQNEPRITK